MSHALVILLMWSRRRPTTSLAGLLGTLSISADVSGGGVAGTVAPRAGPSASTSDLGQESAGGRRNPPNRSRNAWNAPSRPWWSGWVASHWTAYDRTTSLASRSEPSWNLTPLRSVHVQIIGVGVGHALLCEGRRTAGARGCRGGTTTRIAERRRAGLASSVSSAQYRPAGSGGLHHDELRPVAGHDRRPAIRGGRRRVAAAQVGSEGGGRADMGQGDHRDVGPDAVVGAAVVQRADRRIRARPRQLERRAGHPRAAPRTGRSNSGRRSGDRAGPWRRDSGRAPRAGTGQSSRPASACGGQRLERHRLERRPSTPRYSRSWTCSAVAAARRVGQVVTRLVRVLDRGREALGEAGPCQPLAGAVGSGSGHGPPSHPYWIAHGRKWLASSVPGGKAASIMAARSMPEGDRPAHLAVVERGEPVVEAEVRDVEALAGLGSGSGSARRPRRRPRDHVHPVDRARAQLLEPSAGVAPAEDDRAGPGLARPSSRRSG